MTYENQRLRKVLGIDPGQSGALAWVYTNGELFEVEDMPVVGTDVNANLMAKLIIGYGRLECAVVERQQAYPKQGVSSSFKTGTGYGIVIGVLGALEIPTFYITAGEWKRQMHLTNDKELSRRMALDRWPRQSDLFRLKKHSDRAEAALLAVSWIKSDARRQWAEESADTERPLSKRRLIPRSTLRDSATVRES